MGIQDVSNTDQQDDERAVITSYSIHYTKLYDNEQMRSDYKKSEKVRTYVELLREAGYYCTNNSKTDYNCSNIDPNQIWDESRNNFV